MLAPSAKEEGDARSHRAVVARVRQGPAVDGMGRVQADAVWLHVQDILSGNVLVQGYVQFAPRHAAALSGNEAISGNEAVARALMEGGADVNAKARVEITEKVSTEDKVRGA